MSCFRVTLFLLFTLIEINNILAQSRNQSKSNSFDATDPKKWKLLADKRFEKFSYEKSFNHPKNVILFIGDGLSIATITGARYMKAQKMNRKGGDIQMIWDDWPVASLVRTFSSDNLVTDSGSSATALVSGAKTNTKVIGLTGKVECCKCAKFEDWEAVNSSFILAANAGLSVGIVTTTRVTHATPAATYAKIQHRDWESEIQYDGSDIHCLDIATQIITNGIDFNVIFGGGVGKFLGNKQHSVFNQAGERKDSKDLLKEWKKQQTKKKRTNSIVHNKKELDIAINSNISYVLGLFHHSNMEYDITSPDQITLAEMTQAAIQILSRNPKGYLLLVEGGRIDHAHHDNKAQLALTETLAFEKAIQKASELQKNKETLIIVTADHSQSYGLVGYPKRDTSVIDLVDSTKADDGKSYLVSTYHNGPGASSNQPRSDPATLSRLQRFETHFRQQALVPLHYSTHSGEDVPLYAIGPYSKLFHGSFDNTFVAYSIMYSLCIGPYEKYEHCIQKNSAINLNKNFIIIIIHVLISFIPFNLIYYYYI